MNSVSIIIPTYNGVALLQKHLPDVIAALRKHDEIIIVDDASTDETFSWLKETYGIHEDECSLPDIDCYLNNHKDIEIRVLVNQSNQRFASSCNRGVSSAKSDIIILLNNDVSPKVDFLKYLLPHFEDEHVFAVGCKELASAESNKEYGRSIAHFERGFLIHQRAQDQDGRDTFWASGGSSGFRTSMWKQLHGFDLDYKPAYWEDIDLSYRGRMLGWKIEFEPQAIVYHVHETTLSAVFGKRGVEIMSYRNSILFMWKNAKGKELLHHFCWLPYHLFFTTIRSDGNFFFGFIQALKTIV